MSTVGISGIAFAFVFGSALVGMALRSVLPQHHLGADSKDVVKLTMGLLGTMAALVLGLLTSSAKGTFDAQDNELKQIAAETITLDRTLASYGPETWEIRVQMRGVVERYVARTWPETGAAPTADTSSGSDTRVESIAAAIGRLTPETDQQRALKSRAENIAASVVGTRWLAFTLASSAPPLTLLVVLVFWLAVLFLSFGIYAPRNGTVLGALFLGAFSVAGSIMLILEMSRPLDGLIRISGAPLRFALAHMTQ